ncbi:hypothetical protein COCON_G00150150 [Conger conger]|uniref:Uncharacterized protein n=1 Tax=Conger conger TaxID=82655 RepID=A0A9Q1DCG3_CONCO|nr:hypothetical protein COCON_G00150150 [Conger conger]
MEQERRREAHRQKQWECQEMSMRLPEEPVEGDINTSSSQESREQRVAGFAISAKATPPLRPPHAAPALR